MESIFYLMCVIWVTFTLTLAQEDEREPFEGYPICIVGAGLSGLGIATLLQERGQAVKIFESLSRAGGKVHTFRDDLKGIQAELGPCGYAPFDEYVVKYVNEFGLKTIPLDALDRVPFDTDSGKNLSTLEELKALEEPLKNYLGLYEQFEGQHYFDLGFIETPPSLFVSTAEWLHNQNLDALKQGFQLLMTNLGYGSLDDTPAIYALKYVRPELIRALLRNEGSYLTLRDGLDGLVDKMAENLDIYLSHEVTRIDRAGDFQIIYFKNETQKCSNVILAFSPLASIVKQLVPDLTAREEKILGEVKIHKWGSAVHHMMVPLNHTIYFDPQPKGQGQVVLLVEQKPKEVYTSYSWIRGNFDKYLPADLEAFDKGRRDLMKMGNFTTVARETSDYFPHVSSEALGRNFYGDFNSIQGSSGLFYGTTLLGFESMNGALEMAEEFVGKYF